MGSGEAATVKVLYAVGHYRNFTGSQRSLSLLVRHLPDDVETVVVFPGEGRATEEFRAGPVRTVVLRAPARLDVIGGQLLRTSVRQAMPLAVAALLPYNVRFFRLLRRERPTIVHCNDSRALLLVGYAARAAGIPVIWHLRGASVLQGWMDRVARSLSSCIVSVADAVAPPAEAGLPVVTLYNAAEPMPVDVSDVATEAEKHLRDRGFDPAQTVRIVTASSLHPYKGLHHLVDALADLFRRAPAWRGRVAWFVLGDDDGDAQRRYRRHLEAMARTHELSDTVIWLGWQPTPLAWIAASDVVVLPTVSEELFTYDDGSEQRVECMEGLPRTILEAMTAGRPTVASAVAGVEELITDGETGLLVPPGDPEALSAAVEALLSDPDLRTRLGEGARAAVGAFSIPAMVDQMMAVYRRVAAQAEARR